jgi:hypothetical protein
LGVVGQFNWLLIYHFSIIWIFMPVGNGILFHRVRGQKLIKTKKKKGQKLIGF